MVVGEELGKVKKGLETHKEPKEDKVTSCFKFQSLFAKTPGGLQWSFISFSSC